MKRKLITLSVLLLSGSSLFAQKLTEIPSFNSDEEKAAWIKEHPQDYERISGEKVTVMPTFSTGKEKEAWIKANPHLYKAAGGELIIPEFKTKEEKEKFFGITPQEEQEKEVSDIDPTFPVYVRTGDPVLDNQRYMEAKDEWIRNNPEKYENLQNPKEEAKPENE